MARRCEYFMYSGGYFTIWVCVLCHIALACSNTVYSLYSLFSCFFSPSMLAWHVHTLLRSLSLARLSCLFSRSPALLGSIFTLFLFITSQFLIHTTHDIWAFSLSHLNGNSYKAAIQSVRRYLLVETSECCGLHFTIFGVIVVICVQLEITWSAWCLRQIHRPKHRTICKNIPKPNRSTLPYSIYFTVHMLFYYRSRLSFHFRQACICDVSLFIWFGAHVIWVFEIMPEQQYYMEGKWVKF